MNNNNNNNNNNNKDTFWDFEHVERKSLIDDALKKISFFEIFLLIILFILFNIIIISFHSFDERVFVFWDLTSGKPLYRTKEVGIFLIPFVTLIFFILISFASMFSWSYLDKQRWHFLKMVLTILGIIMNSYFLFVNFEEDKEPSLSFLSIVIFSSISCYTGGRSLILLWSHYRDKFSPSFTYAFPLFEAVLLILIGVVSLNGFFFSPRVKSLSLMLFLFTFGFGILYSYKLYNNHIEQQRQFKSFLASIREKSGIVLPHKVE